MSGQYVFAAVGILTIGYWACGSANAVLFQRKEAQHFAREVETQVAFEAAGERSASSLEVEPQAPQEGAVMANLAIPRIGFSIMVVEGDKEGDLKLAIGHIPGTALPGKPGNIGIAGHRDTFFRPLRLISKDDVIVITTLHEVDRYKVVSTKIVGPDDVRVLYPTGRDTLTLVTCYPFYYVGPAPERFIVRAERFEASEKTAPQSFQ
jgi:sortase A